MTGKAGKAKAARKTSAAGGKAKTAKPAPGAAANRAHAAWVRSGGPARVSRSLEARGTPPVAPAIIVESKRQAAASAKRAAGRKSARRKPPGGAR